MKNRNHFAYRIERLLDADRRAIDVKTKSVPPRRELQ